MVCESRRNESREEGARPWIELLSPFSQRTEMELVRASKPSKSESENGVALPLSG